MMAISRKSALWQHAQERQQSSASNTVKAQDTPDVKAQMASIRAHFDDARAEVSATPWIRAAAVLAYFNPSKLRSAEGETLENFEAFSALLEASALAPNAGGLRLLPLSERRTQLRAMGTRAEMLRYLEANEPAPEVPVQQAFKKILDGAASVQALRDEENEEQLAALCEALLWVQGILDDLPGRDLVLEDLAKLRIFQPLRVLVGTHFAGRENLIEKLTTYFHAPQDVNRIFYLYGMGGTGKSTVLAKFALDLLKSDEVDQIVYLNFDRAALDVRDPMTVLREVLQQLAAQTQDDSLLHLRDGIDLYARRYASGRNVLESSMDGGGGWQDMMSGVGQAIGAIKGSGPILILVDTFESAQRMGESAVRELWRMFTALAETTDRLRIIAAGRVDSFQIFENTTELAGLEPDAVRDVLESICAQKLPVDVVADVVKSTKGRPLGVVLAGHYFRRLGVSKLSNPQVRANALLDVHSEQAEAVLYNRVLGQIANPVVRRLSRPGLLLRFVTPGLIRDVLGPVTDQHFDENTAYAVFDAYNSEVDLVEPGMASWGEPLLTHRTDVRALMLPDLRAYDPERVRKLDTLAIAFFEQQAGTMARSEEIYHRCFSDETTQTLDARWLEGCVPYLQGALSEVPVAKRPWLANRLGVDLPAEAEAAASLAEWEAFAARTVQNRLDNNDVEGALKVLGQRADRLPGSTLYALHADALSRQAHVWEARAVIDRGLTDAAESGMRGTAAELYLVRSLIHERNREFVVASRDALRAYRIAEDLELKGLTLRGLSVLLRLHRKSENVEGPRQDHLIARANEVLDDVGDNALRDQPGLMRSLAGELGPTRPDLLARSIQISGQDVISAPSPDLLAVEDAATDELLKANHEELADVMARVESENGETLRNLMTVLVNAAVERGMLSKVAGPLASILAAEVDQLIAAFPSPSMQKRSVKPAWKKAVGLLIRR